MNLSDFFIRFFSDETIPLRTLSPSAKLDLVTGQVSEPTTVNIASVTRTKQSSDSANDGVLGGEKCHGPSVVALTGTRAGSSAGLDDNSVALADGAGFDRGGILVLALLEVEVEARRTKACPLPHQNLGRVVGGDHLVELLSPLYGSEVNGGDVDATRRDIAGFEAIILESE